MVLQTLGYKPHHLEPSSCGGTQTPAKTPTGKTITLEVGYLTLSISGLVPIQLSVI